jgi:hypothetical protein
MHRYSPIISLFFIAAYLWSATPFREVMKLPALMCHLRHHVIQHQESGLISFLIDHYTQEDGTDEDAAEDRQLPFKSTDVLVSGTTVALKPPTSFQTIIQLFEIENESFVLMNDQWPANAFASSIWQPPKQPGF